MDTKTAIVTGRGTEIVEFLQDTSVFSKFQDAMDSRAVRPFIQSVLLVVASRPELWSCEPESVMVSALQIALLRLSVEPTLGHAYLAPFKDHGISKCQKIVGYKGLKQLAIRTHVYQAMNVARVWEGERMEIERMSGRTQIVGTPTSYTKIVGRVGYFKMNDGYEKFLPMTTAEIHAHAKQFSKGYEHPMSSWKNPRMVGAMEEKTPFRLLILRDGYLDPFDMSLVRGEDLPPSPLPTGRGGEVVDVTQRADTQVRPDEPTPQPPSYKEGGVRTPEEVKAWIVAKAGELAMRNRTIATGADRALVAMKLNECFEGDPMADKKRHDVLLYLTGYATVPNLPGTTVRALIEWLVLGESTLREGAREEARGVWKAVGSGKWVVGSGKWVVGSG